MKRKFFILLATLFVSLVLFVSVFSAGRIFRMRGIFVPESTWTGGHPGSIIFDIGDSNSWFTSTIDESWYLSGFFWLWNVGWSTYNHDDASCRARIVCPSDILRNPNQLCPMDGCAWSQNAGWIVLSGSSIDSSSTGVYYNPITTLIEGFAWSRSLWWIPFYSEMGTPITTITQSGITADGLGVNFIWKIAIIGNIAWTRIYESAYQTVANIFSTTKHAEIMNSVHKNIALLSRNIDSVTLMDELSPFNFLVDKTADITFDFNRSWPTNKRTLVVVGHDIILDQEDINPNPESYQSRALVALKDFNWSGWNIIITDKVKRIYAFMYAEWTVFSGEKTVTWAVIPYVASGSWNIPTNQLYIKWMLISKNTVWWAQQVPSVCPVVINDCTIETSEIYDLDFFRSYDPNTPSQKSIPTTLIDSRLDRSSMVIQYDQWVLSDPPPWLDKVFQ
jgi:hypothetical protein